MKKWRPDMDLRDPKGWKAAGVSRWTWWHWLKRAGMPSAKLEWTDRDWAGDAQKLVDQGRVRHFGDLCLQLSVAKRDPLYLGSAAPRPKPAVRSDRRAA